MQSGGQGPASSQMRNRRRENASGLEKAQETRQGDQMLYGIAIVLGVLWLLGLVTGYTAGYFIHILLVIAIAMVVFNAIQGRRPV